MHIGQAAFDAVVLEGQRLVIETEQVEDGGVLVVLFLELLLAVPIQASGDAALRNRFSSHLSAVSKGPEQRLPPSGSRPTRRFRPKMFVRTLTFGLTIG